MSTSCLSRFQIDRSLRRSKENIEIVPQETCEQYESTESVLTECATSQTPTKAGTILQRTPSDEIGATSSSSVNNLKQEGSSF